MNGTLHALYGYTVVETSKHPVAPTITTGSSTAISACLMAVGAPQPGHILCPSVKGLFFLVSCLRSITAIFFILLEQTDISGIFAKIVANKAHEYFFSIAGEEVSAPKSEDVLLQRHVFL